MPEARRRVPSLLRSAGLALRAASPKVRTRISRGRAARPGCERRRWQTAAAPRTAPETDSRQPSRFHAPSVSVPANSRSGTARTLYRRRHNQRPHRRRRWSAYGRRRRRGPGPSAPERQATPGKEMRPSGLPRDPSVDRKGSGDLPRRPGAAPPGASSGLPCDGRRGQVFRGVDLVVLNRRLELEQEVAVFRVVLVPGDVRSGESLDGVGRSPESQRDEVRLLALRAPQDVVCLVAGYRAIVGKGPFAQESEIVIGSGGGGGTMPQARDHAASFEAGPPLDERRTPQPGGAPFSRPTRRPLRPARIKRATIPV